MLVETKEEIFDYIKDVENLMDRRFQGTDSKTDPDFPSGWWICCINLWIRKNLMKSMIVWKGIIWWGTMNVHLLMALQRAETSVIIWSN